MLGVLTVFLSLTGDGGEAGMEGHVAASRR